MCEPEAPVRSDGMSANSNPLLEALNVHGFSDGSEAARDDVIRRFGFAVPNRAAIDAVAAVSENGVIEAGAGVGYWAWMLEAAGVDVVAYDLYPPPSDHNKWFAGVEPWVNVVWGDERAAAAAPQRTLLVVWPTRNEIWAANTVEAYHRAGGTCIVYVGEPPGGRTGDDALHKLVGSLDRCTTCDYGLTNAACVCTVSTLFAPSKVVELPHWPGIADDLSIHYRLTAPPRLCRPGFGRQRPRRP